MYVRIVILHRIGRGFYAMSEQNDYILSAEEILMSIETYLAIPFIDELVKKRKVEDLIISIRRLIGYPRDTKRTQQDMEIREKQREINELDREIEKLKSEKNKLNS